MIWIWMEWLGIRHKSLDHIIMIHHNSPQLTTCLSNANDERGFLAKAGTQAQHGTARCGCHQIQCKTKWRSDVWCRSTATFASLENNRL